jgi:hypothetical protein
MKQVIFKTIILAVSTITFFTACKKDNVEPVQQKVQLLSPSNAAAIPLDALKQSTTFRWSFGATSPAVTYRLRVWQLMQGQNASSALHTNPLYEVDIKGATETTVNALLTGPCRPPYLCDFVWLVAVLNSDGSIAEQTMSSTGTFSVQ